MSNIRASENEEKKLGLFNWPNIISYIRILCTIGINIALYKSAVKIACFLTIIGSVSDFFDGYIARKLKQESEYGAKLDLIADKIFSINFLLIMYKKTHFLYKNWHFFINISVVFLLISREITMIILRNIQKKAIPASRLGKIKTVILNLGYIIFFISPTLAWLFIYVGAIFSTISQLQYIRNERKIK